MNWPTLSPELAAVLASALKSTLIIGISALVVFSLRRRAALSRSWVWRSAVLGLLAVAALQVAPQHTPRLTIAVPAAVFPRPIPAPAPPSLGVPMPKPMLITTPTTRFLMPWKLLWGTGALLLLLGQAARWCAGAWWLHRHAAPAPAELVSAAQKCAALLGLRRVPRVAVSKPLPTPLLAGWWRPTLHLPVEAAGWPAATLQAVLWHELTHARRQDLWWQRLAQVTTCLWWWQPLAWWAARRLREAAEEVADDAVLLRQPDARSYARLLVAWAAGLRQPVLADGLSLLSRSPLEARLREILRVHAHRGRFSGWALAGAALLALSFLILGATYLRAQAPVPAPAADPVPVARGRVLDEAGHPVAGARIEPFTDIKGDTHQYGSTAHDSMRTAPDGTFAYYAKNHTGVGVVVIAPGYARAMEEIPYAPGQHDIVLHRGVAVTGRLLKGTQPVAGVEVEIAQVARNAQTDRGEIKATTDAEGRFRIEDASPNDEYVIYAKRNSLAALGVTMAKSFTVGPIGKTVDVGDLKVLPGVRITGKMRLTDGAIPQPASRLRDPNGKMSSSVHRVQLHIRHFEKGSGWSNPDFQYMNLDEPLEFSFLALPGERLELHGFMPNYRNVVEDQMTRVAVEEVTPAVLMIYAPQVAEVLELTAPLK